MIYDSTKDYPRDLHGYGRDVPHAQWPSQARIAVQFVLNFEEGGKTTYCTVTLAPNNFSRKCSTQPATPIGT